MRWFVFLAMRYPVRLIEPWLQIIAKPPRCIGQVAVCVEFVFTVEEFYSLLERRRMRWKAMSIPKPPKAIA
jgi:hypothetical protein